MKRIHGSSAPGQAGDQVDAIKKARESFKMSRDEFDQLTKNEVTNNDKQSKRQDIDPVKDGSGKKTPRPGSDTTKKPLPEADKHIGTAVPEIDLDGSKQRNHAADPANGPKPDPGSMTSGLEGHGPGPESEDPSGDPVEPDDHDEPEVPGEPSTHDIDPVGHDEPCPQPETIIIEVNQYNEHYNYCGGTAGHVPGNPWYEPCWSPCWTPAWLPSWAWCGGGYDLVYCGGSFGFFISLNADTCWRWCGPFQWNWWRSCWYPCARPCDWSWYSPFRSTCLVWNTTWTPAPVVRIEQPPTLPTPAMAWSSLADRRFDDALNQFMQLDTAFPDEFESRLGAGIALAASGPLGSGVSLVRQAVSADPRILLAVNQHRQLDPILVEILNDWTIEAHQSPGNADALFMVSTLQVLTGQEMNAFFTISLAIERGDVEPGSLQLWSMLENTGTLQ